MHAGCTRGFPTQQLLRAVATGGLGTRNRPYFNRVRLIPGMNFTCNGTITRVTVAGETQPAGRQGIKLNVWRENESGHFYKCGQGIVLSSDICRKFQNYDNAFECRLSMRTRLSVESGDILGIEVPRRDAANFELYSVSARGLTNYIFNGNNLHPTVDLCDRINEAEVRPLIMLGITRMDQGS